MKVCQRLEEGSHVAIWNIFEGRGIQAGRQGAADTKALKEIEIYKFPWVFKSLVDPGTVIPVSCTGSSGPPEDQLKIGFRGSQRILVAKGREQPGETRRGQ